MHKSGSYVLEGEVGVYFKNLRLGIAIFGKPFSLIFAECGNCVGKVKDRLQVLPVSLQSSLDSQMLDALPDVACRINGGR